MALRKEKFKPASLVQYFDPPEDYFGSFGWVCGYSADPDFLNLAIERFTGKTKSTRARDGLINIVLMLDKGSAQLTMTQVPGVYHAGRSNKLTQPFRLLHAKIVLLYFKHVEDSKKSHLRLLVSTGNWTSQTLSESLDLVCCLDLESADFLSGDDNKKQIRADIFTAWSFIKDLRRYFHYSILTSKKDTETFILFNSFENILNAIPKPRGCMPRFFDNRKFSLLEQLPELIKTIGGAVARNYIAFGSGFYQKPHSSKKIPSVLSEILLRLQENNLLTRNAIKEIILNPEACQAIAKSIGNLLEDDWVIRKAIDPLDFKRELHAKFIFCGNERGGSNSCSRPWLYMGSGNLTEAGFTNRMSSDGGNLEAGIILLTGNLFWQHDKKLDFNKCVNLLLPITRDGKSVIYLNSELQTGEGMPECIEDFIGSPVSWFNWIEIDNSSGILIPGEISDIEFHLVNQENQACLKDNDGNWIWNSDQPSIVKVIWGPQFEFECFVPVIDSFGRIAGKKLNLLELDEAWWQLEGFPNFTAEEDDEDESDLPELDMFAQEKNHIKTKIRTQSYPIRKMMELLEKIADKQTAVQQADWKFWCNRLEQSLIQTKGNNIYELFKKMNLNPLAPLRDESFRPDFAKNKKSDEGEYYEAVLEKIETSLELNKLASL